MTRQRYRLVRNVLLLARLAALLVVGGVRASQDAAVQVPAEGAAHSDDPRTGGRAPLLALGYGMGVGGGAVDSRSTSPHPIVRSSSSASFPAN